MTGTRDRFPELITVFRCTVELFRVAATEIAIIATLSAIPFVVPMAIHVAEFANTINTIPAFIFRDKDLQAETPNGTASHRIGEESQYKYPR